MATFTENDLKELKDFILGQFKEVNSKIDKLSEEVNNLRVDLANVKGELTGVNKRLDIVISIKIENINPRVHKGFVGLDCIRLI